MRQMQKKSTATGQSGRGKGCQVTVGENMDLKDQKWVDQINGNSGIFGLIWMGSLQPCLPDKLRNRTYSCRDDSNQLFAENGPGTGKNHCVVNRNQHSAMCISCKYYGAWNYKTY